MALNKNVKTDVLLIVSGRDQAFGPWVILGKKKKKKKVNS